MWPFDRQTDSRTLDAAEARLLSRSNAEYAKQTALESGMPKIMRKIRKAAESCDLYVCVDATIGEVLALRDMGFRVSDSMLGSVIVSWDEADI